MLIQPINNSSCNVLDDIFIQTKYDNNINFFNNNKININKDVDTSENKKYQSSKRWWQYLWGEPFSNKIYLGMWTKHMKPREYHTNNNRLIAICYRGYYCGTFINSTGDRVYSAGFKRALYNKDINSFNIEAGYKLGIMHGYKEDFRLLNTAFFPLLQCTLDLAFKSAVVQLSWAGVTFSISLGYKL